MDGLTQVLVGVHSIWRYVVLVTAFLAIGNMLMGFLEKRAWKGADARIGRYFVIAIDLEILFGVLIWLLQTRWDGADLLRSWRHPALMLLAALVAHYGWWRARRIPIERARFGLLTMYFVIAGIVIVLGVLQIQGVF